MFGSVLLIQERLPRNLSGLLVRNKEFALAFPIRNIARYIATLSIIPEGGNRCISHASRDCPFLAAVPLHSPPLLHSSPPHLPLPPPYSAPRSLLVPHAITVFWKQSRILPRVNREEGDLARPPFPGLLGKRIVPHARLVSPAGLKWNYPEIFLSDYRIEEFKSRCEEAPNSLPFRSKSN